MTGLSLMWFRDDLRLKANPALAAAAARPLLAVYILDDETPGLRPLGGAARWWLHHSLQAVQKDLRRQNIPLLIFRGAAFTVLKHLLEKLPITHVHWNRRYGSERNGDEHIKAFLKDQNIVAHSHPGNVLLEPWKLLNNQGQPYKVFTPFWRALAARLDLTPAPTVNLQGASVATTGLALEDLNLLPHKPNWAKGFDDHAQPGEAGAQEQLEHFLDQGLQGYAAARDRPDLHSTSRLSPHLRFGEITPQQMISAARLHLEKGETAASMQDVDVFCKEIGWRDFSYHLLYHFPDLPTQNWNKTFNHFPWQSNAAHMQAWQKGLTGYPLVDAGMRQLWQTGWMHNRVRMVCASFLTKHLRMDWRLGETWFWDTLLDADPASNAASWQWVAGSGADAAPYFRIFNPVIQGEKFDPDGTYVRHFIPEIAALPNTHIHKPWAAPPSCLKEAGVVIGQTYPAPVVDHARARAAALAAYAQTKE